MDIYKKKSYPLIPILIPTLELDVSHALVLLSWMLSLMRDFNNKEKKIEMQL